jgi:hypothetical protein
LHHLAVDFFEYHFRRLSRFEVRLVDLCYDPNSTLGLSAFNNNYGRRSPPGNPGLLDNLLLIPRPKQRAIPDVTMDVFSRLNQVWFA